jgi:hypothetical protein
MLIKREAYSSEYSEYCNLQLDFAFPSASNLGRETMALAKEVSIRMSSAIGHAWKVVTLATGLVSVVGCSSDGGQGSGGSSGGGIATGGAGNAGAGGTAGSSGGMSGAAGSVAAPSCEQMCNPELRIDCPASDFQGCVEFCESALTEKPECQALMEAAASCANDRADSDFECSEDGTVSLMGDLCAAEQKANCDCLIGPALCG